MKLYPESYNNLSEFHFKKVHIYLCKSALNQLHSYAKNVGPLEYISSRGIVRYLDLTIPRDAIRSVLSTEDILDVSERYGELKSDLNGRASFNFDEDMYLLWCSIHNLYEKYIVNKKHSNSIIITQALFNCSDAEFSIRLEKAIELSS